MVVFNLTDDALVLPGRNYTALITIVDDDKGIYIL